MSRRRHPLRLLWPALVLGALGQAALAAEGAAGCGPSQLGSPCGQGGPASLAAPGPVASVGNPVHLATGNKYQRDVDLPAMPGVLGLEVVRHYNALDPRRGALGHAWQLSYDTRLHDTGEHIAIVQPDGARLDFSAGDHAHAPCTPVDPAHGEVQRIKGMQGERYRWTWRDGRILAFDARGLLVSITERGARLNILRGRVPGTPAYGRAVRITDPAGRSLQLSYAGDPGVLVRIETPVGELRYRYDAGSGLTEAVYPDGHARRYAYDPALRERGRLALTRLFVRRPDGGELLLGAWDYADDGRVATTYAGAPAEPAAALSLHYARQGRNWQTEVRSATGDVTHVTLAAAGARHHVTQATGSACPGCAAPGTRATVDAAGAVPSFEDATTVRDALGRPVSVGGAAGYTLGWLEQTTLPLTVTGPSRVPGRTRALEFDWSRHDTPTGPVRVPVRVRETGWRASTDSAAPQPLAREWQLSWAWSEKGMRLARAVVDPPGSATFGAVPPPGERAPAGWPDAQARWDDFGRVHRWQSAATGEEVRTVDAQGRLAARRFANGQVWRYVHDDQGRLVHLDLGGETVDVAWTDDLPTQITHPEERERRAYDAQGRLTGRTVRRPAMGTPRLAYEDTFMRDAEGRIVVHRLPEGGALHYRWGAGRRLAGIVWEDGAGRRHEVVVPATGRGYALGNGVTVRARTHDGGMAGVRHVRPDGALVLDHALHQAQGRVVADVLQTPAGRHAGAYGYDAQGRLRVQARQAAPGVAPSADRHDWSDDGSASAAAHAIQRDASGLPTAVGERRLGYGPTRRLASVEENGQPLVAYRHNALGERIHRAPAQGRAEDFLFVGNRLAAVWRDGGIVRRYVYANDAPVAMIEYARPASLLPPAASGWRRLLHPGWALLGSPTATLYFLHADAMGLAHVVTDAQGHTRWTGEFDAFGALRAATGDLDPLLRLPGQWFDAATGWHDNYLRTYDPAAGHYLEPDPLGPAPWLAGTPGIATRTSAFGYAAQQPRRHADPLGLVLFAFDGTLSVLAEPTNAYHFAMLYGDIHHPEPGLHFIPSPGRPDALLDATLGYSGPAVIQTQWDRLIEHLSGLQTGGPVEPIDLVGYSRGAGLARQFANDLAAQVRQGRFWQWVDGLGAVTACVDLRFMGFFDTVTQMGLGATDHKYDFTIAPDWSLVAHAVALHEQRRLFPLMTLANADGSMPANAIELPFVGAHADVGGGIADRVGDTGDLSDIALMWMMQMARRVGVPMRDPWPAQQTVSDPSLHDMRGRAERAAERQAAQLAASLGLAPGWQAQPVVSFPDRAVLAADGTVLADRQYSHPTYGAQARREVDAFIHWREGRLDDTDQVVGTVDLVAYAAWLAAQQGGVP